jgi:DNA-binding transcriptional LysR family regulator
MLDSGIDLAFGAEPVPGANYVSREIGYAQWGLCSSTEYLKKTGTPKQLNDLTSVQQATLAGLGIAILPALSITETSKPNAWYSSYQNGN